MRFSFILLLFYISTISYSQTLLTNKKPVDASRYGDMSGSAYYFEDAVRALVLMKDTQEPYELSINVNIYEPMLEVYEGNMYSEIDLQNVAEVVVPDYDGLDTLRFSKVNRDFLFKLYNGLEYQLFQKPLIKLETITHRPPGQIITKKKLTRYDSYFIRHNDKTKNIDINKKDILIKLGPDAAAAAKSAKNKLKSVSDLVDLLKALEAK